MRAPLSAPHATVNSRALVRQAELDLRRAMVHTRELITSGRTLLRSADDLLARSVPPIRQSGDAI